MNVTVKYKGRRAETLAKYNDKRFRKGPYDFSKGECLVDEKDAALLLKESPVGFVMTMDVEETEAAAKEAKEAPKAAAAKK